MSSNFVNQAPFLRTSRQFPPEINLLTVEVNRSYIDIANAVNVRTISIFPVTRPAITGEAWFLNKNRLQQGFRQVYTFTAAGSIPHGLDLTDIFGFVRIFGTFTDGTNWYPLPYVDTVAITNQVKVVVTPTNIVITAGGGSPVISSGIVVLEWLSLP